MTPIFDLYDHLAFNKYQALYVDRHDAGFRADHEFPCAVFDIDDTSALIKTIQETKDHRFVGVIADTHGYEKIDQVISYLNKLNIDLLIHAGDIGRPEFLDKLMNFRGDVYGVLGNHDRPEAAAYLPIIESWDDNNGGRLRLGYEYLGFHYRYHDFFVIHEHGERIKPYMESLINRGYGSVKQTIIFGHIHRPLLYSKPIEQVGDYFYTHARILNPGICSKDPKWDLGYESTFCLYCIEYPMRSVFIKL